MTVKTVTLTQTLKTQNKPKNNYCLSRLVFIFFFIKIIKKILFFLENKIAFDKLLISQEEEEFVNLCGFK